MDVSQVPNLVMLSSSRGASKPSSPQMAPQAAQDDTVDLQDTGDWSTSALKYFQESASSGMDYIRQHATGLYNQLNQYCENSFLNGVYDRSTGNGMNQESKGNCASVATIKAAMDKWGPDGVFTKERTEANDGYELTLKDGDKVTVTDAQIAEAEKEADFGSADKKGPAYQNAVICYAAMAQRNLDDSQKGYTEVWGDAAHTYKVKGQRLTTYKEALDDLADGEDPWNTTQFLGLEKNRGVVKDFQTLDNKDSVLAWSNDHAIFVDRVPDYDPLRQIWKVGNVADSYGTGVIYGGNDTGIDAGEKTSDSIIQALYLKD